MAKLHDKRKYTKGAEHIFYILKEYKPGLPCTSSLFANWTGFNFRNRPDEMEIKSCFVECGKSKLDLFRSFQSEINFIKLQDTLVATFKMFAIRGGKCITWKIIHSVCNLYTPRK